MAVTRMHALHRPCEPSASAEDNPMFIKQRSTECEVDLQEHRTTVGILKVTGFLQLESVCEYLDPATILAEIHLLTPSNERLL